MAVTLMGCAIMTRPAAPTIVTANWACVAASLVTSLPWIIASVLVSLLPAVQQLSLNMLGWGGGGYCSSSLLFPFCFSFTKISNYFSDRRVQ